jgi:hypothetical protein
MGSTATASASASATATATATVDTQGNAGSAQIEDMEGGRQEEKEKEEPYVSYVRAPALWPDCHSALSEGQWCALLGSTAERLYGPFE